MSDINLKQVQAELNDLFVTYRERKLIFWFDQKKEFEEDIDNKRITLKDAKIIKMNKDSQLTTKRFLEIEDTENNYLIYAPFKKMNNDDENNHLLSILKYSRLFSADRLALVMTQLKIPSELHDTMEKYSKFFGAKSRLRTFERNVTTNIKSEEELEMAIMATLTKANTTQFYSIVQALLVEGATESNELYGQLVNYNLEAVFWEYIRRYYGYYMAEPSIQKLTISFFVNTFYAQLGYQELPSSLKEYEIFDQTIAISSFMDAVMNDARDKSKFKVLSSKTFQLINGNKLLSKISIEELVGSDLFEVIHIRFLEYYSAQLLSGDITPTLNGMMLEEVVINKQRAHFGEKYFHHYELILNAQKILNYVMNINENQFSLVLEDYEKISYKIDLYYRKFIWHLDQIATSEDFGKLYQLIEKKYKSYLDEIGRLWNELLVYDERDSIMDFYGKFAKDNVKTVIIISDALRYESAKEIQTILEKERKYSTNMNTMFSLLPSVTEFGKAALLRDDSESFNYINGSDVRVNGMKTQGTVARDKILKDKNPNSLAITYEEVRSRKNSKELRELFNGQDIIYLYHDLIDEIGDGRQETHVFDAVEKTIWEMKSLIKSISNGANVYRFIITSDHGFIYTRSKVEDYEKIENPSTDPENDRVNRRFIISKNRYDEIGVQSVKIGKVMRNEDERYIHFPETSAIFKKAGGGQSYVHGGASPQEMLIPVLEINVARGSSEKEQTSIQLMTAKRTIIGLSVSLEFYQMEAISDSVTSVKYALYFEDGSGTRITNENTYYADSTSDAASERFNHFTFDFVNRSYETNEKVYFIVKNEDNEIEAERIEFTIDNPFAGGFGFDI